MFLHTYVHTQIDVYLSSTIAADTAKNHARQTCNLALISPADAAPKLRAFEFIISTEFGQKIMPNMRQRLRDDLPPILY